MILVIGGSGSGKSAYAEKVALECQKEKRHFYLATMHVFGEEGQKKVQRHKRMRAGKGFVTIEQPTDIMQCLPALREAGGGVVLLECMSNLAANEMFDTEEPAGSEQVAEKIVTQIGVLAQETEELVIVTNNVFEDGIVYDTSTMEYLRALGSINVRLAERSDAVVEVIAGIPVARKGKLPVAAAEKQGHRQKGAPGMSVIKSFFIAFSIYSKIPVPQFAWKEEDMRYTLCFFPWVGAVIGLCFLLWNRFAGVYGIPSTARAAVGAVLPLAISGGFHADGFMDTMDALHSYRDRERKLEILKDSHIGAFAVICFVMYELIYLGAVSMITEKEQILVLAAGFFLSRTLSGIGVVSLRCAKTNGMLYQFASEAHRRVVLTALYLQLVLCVGLMLAVSVKTGALACAAAGLTYAYYRQKSYREFGGITGDLAGYFVTLCEGVMAVLVAAAGLIG